ncbi:MULTISPECIES: hypothetical protein [Pseudomonas aeruginosa group]|uniref:hypothetical protein n=1 Tax=Pseudomonas aeruginosa group TaxID=136841 RepID=UPI000A812D25|nr:MULTISPECIES: hypothetical protein [Pseudomonas aeruginosa group]MCW8021067.1 hypothetical protein [Pseudomonas aeruginosa]RTT35355.1 hypothetical protein DY956_16930 [Pseudomonas paraeruginosa]
MKISKHLLVMFISYSALAVADSEIKSGMYLRVGDGGVFNVFLDNHGEKIFRIRTLGSNGHSCSLGGRVDGSRIIVEGPTYADRCDIDVKNTAGKIELSRGRESLGCRDYCGSRAGFYGSYKLAYSLCAFSSYRKRLSMIEGALSSGDKDKGYLLSKELYEKCSQFMDSLLRMGLINKISALNLQRGDKKACRKMQDDVGFFDSIKPEYLPQDERITYEALRDEHAKLQSECS